MLKETGGRGPYSSLVMAVVIVKDVVVFICFAVNIEVSDVVRLFAEPHLHVMEPKYTCTESSHPVYWLCGFWDLLQIDCTQTCRFQAAW